MPPSKSSFDEAPLPVKPAATPSPFDWATPAQPPAKSFDDMPLPTANRNTYGFSQIAQRSKGSSICFGSEVKEDKIHLFCMGSITVLMTGLNST